MDEQVTGQEPDEVVSDVEGQEPSTIDAEALKSELARARREAAKYRTQLRELESIEEERERTEMTEMERLRADLAQAQQERQAAIEAEARQARESAIVAAAAAVGFADPMDAVRLVGELEDIKQAGEAVQALVELKPYLIKQQPTATSPTNPAGQGGPRSAAEMRALVYGRRDASDLWAGGLVNGEG